MTEPREVTDQLDLFRQPLTKSEGDVRPAGSDACAGPSGAASVASPSEKSRKTQMTELAGESFEDIFGPAA